MARETEVRHPIGVVARLTGLTPDALRVWEKRYGAVEPERTGGGHRLYTDGQVRRLSLLKRAVDVGNRIGRITELEDGALEALIDRGQGIASEAAVGAKERGALDQEAAKRAVSALDVGVVEASLRRALLARSPVGFMEGVLAPFLHWVGEAWEAGEITPAHEHAASTAVRGLLTWLLEAAEGVESAPRMVVGTLSGERHEFGAMLAAATAGLAGWTVLYLGPDLPAADMVLAAREHGARAVGVSVVHDADAASMASELEALSSGLGDGVELIVGGRASAMHAAALGELGSTRLRDLGSLRSTLNVLAGAGAGGEEKG